MAFAASTGDRPLPPGDRPGGAAGASRLGRAHGLHGAEHHHPLQAGGDPAPRRVVGGGEGPGAVNTVVLRGGRRVGHNTDARASPRASAASFQARRSAGWCSSAPGGRAPPWPTRCWPWARSPFPCSTRIPPGRRTWRRRSARASARGAPRPAATWRRRWRRRTGSSTRRPRDGRPSRPAPAGGAAAPAPLGFRDRLLPA